MNRIKINEEYKKWKKRIAKGKLTFIANDRIGKNNG